MLLLLPAGIIHSIYITILHTFPYSPSCLYYPPIPLLLYSSISQIRPIPDQTPPIPYSFIPISFLVLTISFPSSNKPNPTPIPDHISCKQNPSKTPRHNTRTYAETEDANINIFRDTSYIIRLDILMQDMFPAKR